MDQNKSFFSFDFVTVLAFVLIGITWFMWNDYMKGKYPHLYGPKKNASKKSIQSKKNTSSLLEKEADEKDTHLWFESEEKRGGGLESHLERGNGEKSFAAIKKEKLFFVEDDEWSFSFSSKGMGIKNFILKKFKNRMFEPMNLGGGKTYFPFQTQVIGDKNPLDFKIAKVSENEYEGSAEFGSAKILKTIRLRSDQYAFDIEIKVTDETRSFPGLIHLISDPVRGEEKRGFFAPSFSEQEVFVTQGEGKERITVEDLGKLGDVKKMRRIQLASINSHYFSVALLNQSNTLPDLRAFKNSATQEVIATLSHRTLQSSRDLNLKFIGFMGPKSYELLGKVHESFFRLVDFGLFGFISKYMLLLMNLFYKVVQNWGLAIILMTVLVRLILLPLNLKSYRSMKSMQEIQPYIKEIRKKFKKDPQRMNQEVMNVMKMHKVNPLGGCLPMLLQFPIFIALYQVLGRSVELYQAPFILWVKDLSVKDPYYVLPVLMGIIMFAQQKITPQPVDSTQAKILMFMPIIFTFFMLALPSGLALYILVSSLFAVIQQFVFMRGDALKKKK